MEETRDLHEAAIKIIKDNYDKINCVSMNMDQGENESDIRYYDRLLKQFPVQYYDGVMEDLERLFHIELTRILGQEVTMVLSEDAKEKEHKGVLRKMFEPIFCSLEREVEANQKANFKSYFDKRREMCFKYYDILHAELGAK